MLEAVPVEVGRDFLTGRPCLDPPFIPANEATIPSSIDNSLSGMMYPRCVPQVYRDVAFSLQMLM